MNLLPIVLSVFFHACFEGVVAPRPQLPIRPVLKASSDVPPSLPLFEEQPTDSELPRGNDLNEVKLRRKLGNDFDEMWSSISEPTGDNAGPHMALSLPVSPWLQSEIDSLNGTYGAEFPDAVSKMADWLKNKVACPVIHEWVDIGALFWPRYLKRGQCVEKDCSWPVGMKCFPSEFTTVTILRWHCTRKSKGKKGKSRKKCKWLNVPYAVLTGCSCDCPK